MSLSAVISVSFYNDICICIIIYKIFENFILTVIIEISYI